MSLMFSLISIFVVGTGQYHSANSGQVHFNKVVHRKWVKRKNKVAYENHVNTPIKNNFANIWDTTVTTALIEPLSPIGFNGHLN